MREKIENHIVFKPLSGDPAHGYEATVLIELCDALMDARDGLLPSQKFLAKSLASKNTPGRAAAIAERLGELGAKENERNLSNKISRGSFTTAFFLMCMDAIGAKQASLEA